MDRWQSREDGSGKGRDKVCGNCLYHHREPNESRERCFRFARFVDHALNEDSRDCDYWTPLSDHPQASA
jgi:hypothetical protein